MGWSDEQIRQRIEHDDEAFSDAISGMADVIMGEHLVRMVYDDRIRTKDAIEEILKYYRVKPQELPESVTTTSDQLEYLMRTSGIMWRTVELQDEWYKDAVGPMLGTRSDDGSAVALMPRAFSGYDFFDVKSGKRIKLTKKTAPMIDLQAICFYKPFPNDSIGLRNLFHYLMKIGRTSDYVLLAAATLAVALIGLLPPFLNQLIYSQVIRHNSVQLLLSVFTFLICVLLSQMLINVYKSLVLAQLTGKMTIAFQAAGMTRMLSMPVHFFKQYSAGDLASRMNNLSGLCTMMVNSVFSVGLTSLFSLVHISQMVHYGAELVAPAIVILLLTVGVSVVSMAVEMKLVHRAMELQAKESGLSYSLVTGIQKIKLAGAEKRAFAKWAVAYTPAAKLIYAPPLVLKVSKVISMCIPLVGTLVVYYFTIKAQVPLADYYAFQSSYGMVAGAFTSLIGAASSFAQIKPIMDLLNPLLKTVPEVSTQKRMVERLSGNIELNHVSFRYSDDMPDVIHDLSLTIRSGQYVAIVGRTGCGKSTLMRLLLGFESPQKGAIYYDGKDINSLDLKSLRRKIGVVMQNGKLFQGDILSNISITAPWITMDDAWKAAETAGVAEDIRRMPMGMYTMISEGSSGVSGGQRQRLMIARAVASNPKILMFDEATSALDNLTQKVVSDSLDNLKCTRIIIAHRLSTIKNCERILVLDQGKIAEEGTYDELIRRNGLFAELVSRQQLDEAQ